MSALWVQIVLLALAFAACSVFSGAETGAYCLNRARQRIRVADRLPRALLIERLTANMAAYVGIILIGNNIAHAGVSVMATLVCEGLHAPRADLVATAVAVPMMFVFCELMPKELFRRHADTLLYRVAPFIAVCAWLFAPAAFLLRGLHRILSALGLETAESGDRLQAQERLRAAIAAAREGGELTAYQATLAQNIFALHSRTVGQVMVALPRVSSLESGMTVERAREQVSKAGHTRHPVHRDRPDRVVGVLSSWDLLFEERPGLTIRNYVEPAFTLPPEEKVASALLRMRQARAKMAVVQQGEKALGIVTLKDLVEEITGELKDL